MARNEEEVIMNRIDLSMKEFSCEISEVDLTALVKLSDAISRAVNLSEKQYEGGLIMRRGNILSYCGACKYRADAKDMRPCSTCLQSVSDREYPSCYADEETGEPWPFNGSENND